MNNTHTTTKIAAGQYEYRGFTIERREGGDWYVGEVGEFADDVVDTLAEGKAYVDFYHDTLPIIQAEREAYAEDLQRTVNNTTQDTNTMTIKANAAAALEADRVAADQWLEDNAHLMSEDVSTEKRLEFGAEYFDVAGSDVDLDGMDYFTRLGQAGVSEATHTVYAEATDKLADSYHVKFVAGTCHANSAGDYVQGSISDSHITEPLIVHPSCKVTKLAYKGTPRTVRKPAAARNVNHVQNVVESHRLNQLANKHQQKARRLAKKEQITLTAAMDRLGF